PRLRRLPVFGSFLREYKRYSPDLSFLIMAALLCLKTRSTARWGLYSRCEMDPETIRALFMALRKESVDYVLVGAVALDVLGIGRLTQDIDLFVRPTAENVVRLRRALSQVWSDPCIEEIKGEELAGEYPAIQYIAPDGTQID